MNPIIRAPQFYKVDRRVVPEIRGLLGRNHGPAENVLFCGRPGCKPKRWPQAEMDGATLKAHISEGRWCVICPGCKAGQVVDPDDPRFYCPKCGNLGIDHRWAHIEFPVAAECQAIERALENRRRENQNWYPGEPVSRLLAENRAHGVPS